MNFEKAEQILKSIGNTTRIKIFKLLAEYNKVGVCSTGIAKKLNIAPATLSRSLKKLKKQGYLSEDNIIMDNSIFKVLN